MTTLLSSPVVDGFEHTTGVLHEEHFSLEHLEQHARQLAKQCNVSNKQFHSHKFLARIVDNGPALREAHRVIAAAVNAGETAGTDAEWLLDNFTIVEEQLREIQEDLPSGFYSELPKLPSGQPRIYHLSLELIAHTDSALDEETLVRFLQAYQEVTALSIGETWAFPIMLRLALVENLRRITAQMLANRNCRIRATEAIAKAEELKHLPQESDCLEDCAPMLIELLEQLEEQGSEYSIQLKELERRLIEHGWDPADIVRVAHRREAANQVLIGNVITSMRLISALDWTIFFEQTNLAEQELRKDPAQIYLQMDPATRNVYRRELERLAKRSELADQEVARLAIAQAINATERKATLLEQHVGYYLIGAGRCKLQSAVHYRKPLVESMQDWLLSHPNLCFLGGLSIATGLLLTALAVAILSLGGSWWLVGGMVLLALLPASEIGLGMVNLFVTTSLPPKLLPKLEFRDGVPVSHATLVVVPAMLTSEKEIESLINRLELHYLANPESALQFALITDYGDADSQIKSADQPLLATAIAEIRRLNEQYGTEGTGPFHLFHRERRWNEREGRWMGWERKRGKLMELNRWLHGGDTSFATIEGNTRKLAPQNGKPSVKFIITLDADTQLPPEAARRLIGTLSHPLNRAQFVDNRVTAGYVLLQPRIGITLGSANRSWYARLFANSPGIDPYCTAASDVYQDLFGEGSFTGKGIYDLEAFERALDGVFPENSILSHDLIEGCHSRVGLVSDIELIDGFPTRYDAEVKRQHRWVRGDWQLLPWLLPRVPSEKGWVANRLSILSRWKIADNLRRSLVAPALMVFLCVGWLVFPRLSGLWAFSAIFAVGFPLLAQAFTMLLHWPKRMGKIEFRQGWLRELGRSAVQIILQIVFLPHRAISMCDAIARTLWRLLISRRRMLEWETAAAAERRLSSSRGVGLPMLWVSPLLSLALFFLITRQALPVAALWLVAWSLAPGVAEWLNQPWVRISAPLTENQRRWLRLAACRTWSYFERFTVAEENWLPPDNFQEYPQDKVAHRVSPTNQGLFLLSTLAAQEFGFVSLQKAINLWERNLEAWLKLERFRGHFLNWYETTTLRALHPRYVSTVDSGNLAVSFLTLKVGCDELQKAELFSTAQWHGLIDSVVVMQQECQRVQALGDRSLSRALENLNAAAAALNTFGDAPESLVEWKFRIEALVKQAKQITQRTQELKALSAFPETNLLELAERLVHLVDDLATDFAAIFPWIHLIASGEITPRTGMDQLAPPWPLTDEAGRNAWTTLLNILEKSRNLATLATLDEQASFALQQLERSWQATQHASRAMEWVAKLHTSLTSSSATAHTLLNRLERLAAQVETLALEMDFKFLYNPHRRLFSIGFNLEENTLDRSHYDMLASEVRLASYLAIAKGDVNYATWFRMGRGLVSAAGQVGLVSWGGTMFEYLMPQLFHREYEGSLIATSCHMAVARQIEHGRNSGVPWGVSESAFSALAGNSDYHYQSFGVPGLGLKRGLEKDLVISPYSTFLALEINPKAAVANLEALTQIGAQGEWGFYEAIDYTPTRLASDNRALIVRCYMAHHQGMSMLSLANVLQGESIRRRFNNHPLGRAGKLLLQERMPNIAPLVEPPSNLESSEHVIKNDAELVSRRLSGYESSTPITHLLSNGHYSTMITNTGGGYSHYRDLAITRWRCDATRDHWGQFLYIHNINSGHIWSATYQPTRTKPDVYHVTYSIDKAEFHRQDGQVETHLEVTVSPDHQAEMRLLKITNHSQRPIELEITSYAEIALTTPAADLAHPAFQKLFIETEYMPEVSALLAKRRPRDAKETPPWAVHVVAAGPNAVGNVEYESSREKFIGRGGSLAHPQSFAPGEKLSGSVGAVLDPIFSLRCRVVIQSNESTSVAFTTAMAATREEAVTLADGFRDLRSVLRVFEMAWAFNQVALRHLQLSPAKSHLFQRLAAALLYPDPARRPDPEMLRANRQSQSGLWRYGISGDAPILLVHITKTEHLELVRDLFTAHRFWREHGLLIDLVVVNDHPGSYLDTLQEQLVNLTNEMHHQPQVRNTNITLLRGAQIPREDHYLLASVTAVVLHGNRGSLAKQLEPVMMKANAKATNSNNKRQDNRSERGTSSQRTPGPLSTISRSIATSQVNSEVDYLPSHELKYFNGIGGFTSDGKEYQFTVTDEERPRKPWTNVLANSRFGCILTESGGGYTWFENSREFKLTSWANDPLLDSPAEWMYLRDERNLEILRPLPQAVAVGQKYTVQYGQGYARYQTTYPGLQVKTTIAVAADDPVKLIRVSITNRGTEMRRCSLTYFAEWVLGVNREQTQLHVNTTWDEVGQVLLANNPYHPDYALPLAFLYVSGAEQSWTGDRAEFIGRSGDPANPAALLQATSLSGKTGAGLDPGGAVQSKFSLAPGEKREMVILLGAGANVEEVRQLVAKYREPTSLGKAIDDAAEQWNQPLSTLQVHTPNPSFDLLVNRWLLYQTIVCRLWARTALYQAGGAYGFRDQLQDVMAVVYSRPDLAREQLLRAAAHQFEEGDVQHWWHPPAGRGTRTRFSDDYLWLPLVTCHYVKITGDVSVLDEVISFLHSPPLEPHEHERYETPQRSSESATLYEHCTRMFTRAFRFGPHGLPLIGCGDWNDGMNKVGEQGQGESVWVGWFLLVILREFIPLMQQRGEKAQADELTSRAVALRSSIETNAWDGAWYRRAFFDDGTPLGSAQNDECQIDSIAQSWAVFAQADNARTNQAMEAVWERLVRKEDGLVLLFAPAFNKTTLDPGYIKGYLPGIRENGGQYTHPALWVIQAFAQMGDTKRAMEVFDLINPIHHATTPQQLEQYQVEPYVVAADVYGVSPHTGRGGWTWYTGSAAWMYRVAIESLLGFQLRGNRLRIEPHVPADWPQFEITWRWKKTTYHITVQRPGETTGSCELMIDGHPQANAEIELIDDGGSHEVTIIWRQV